MAISSFIPKVWSARLQENFHKALVFGSLCSRNYEGEISQWGDTVHISNLSDITVRPYDPTKDLAEPEAQRHRHCADHRPRRVLQLPHRRRGRGTGAR